MRVIGLAGSSDDDRVALAIGVVSELTGRGIKVSVAQRASQGFDVDRPGKDSDRHRAAGATEVMVTSANRWALIHQRGPSFEARIADLTARMSPADLLIADGFVDEDHPCLEVHRSTSGAPRTHDGDNRIVAVASDVPLAGLGVPVFGLGDHPAIADFILGHCRLTGGR